MWEDVETTSFQPLQYYIAIKSNTNYTITWSISNYHSSVNNINYIDLYALKLYKSTFIIKKTYFLYNPVEHDANSRLTAEIIPQSWLKQIKGHFITVYISFVDHTPAFLTLSKVAELRQHGTCVGNFFDNHLMKTFFLIFIR